MGWFNEKVYSGEPIPKVTVSFDNVLTMFREGVVGTKEFRNWLEQVDPAFAKVRDTEVDNQIDQLARERYQAYQDAMRPDEEEGAESRGGADV